MIIRKSFLQHQRESSIPNIKKKIKEIDKSITELKISPQIIERLEIEEKLNKLKNKKYEIIHNLKVLLPVLIEGRVIKITTCDTNPIELNAMVISIKSFKKTYEELNS